MVILQSSYDSRITPAAACPSAVAWVGGNMYHAPLGATFNRVDVLVYWDGTKPTAKWVGQ